MTWLELEMQALDVARSAAGLCANWFIQSTLLIAGGLVVGYALRRQGSAVQSAVYRTTLVAVLACPLATWGLSKLGLTGWSLEMPLAYVHQAIAADFPPIKEQLAPLDFATEAMQVAPSEPIAIEQFSDATALDYAAEVDLVELPSVPPNLPVHTSPAIAAIEPTIAENAAAPSFALIVHWFGAAAVVVSALWIVGASWLLARLAAGWRRLGRIRRGASPADASTQVTCQSIAELLRVAPPDVLHSPFLPSPCLAGLRRPAVMLPDVDVGLPLRDVLIHELAHLARHDGHWNLLRRIATALFFFQPLMWVLSRRLDSTAEEVCDDYVVQFGGDRSEYAHRLVDIAELSIAPLAAGVGIVSFRSMLAARVARIMDTSRSLSTRVGSLLLAIVLAAGLTATLVVGLVGVESGQVVAEAPAAETGSDEAIPAEEPAEVVNDEATTAEDDEVTTVRGRVVDDDERPLAGARVTAAQARFVDERYVRAEHRQVGETRSDSDGTFEISVPKVEFPDSGKNRLSSFDWRPVTITATAPGYTSAWVGGDWYRNTADPLAGDVILRLQKESPTIRGRLVNLEGQPQAGLSVKVISLASAESGKVDAWLADVERLRQEGKLPRAGSVADYVVFASTMVMNKPDDAAQDRRSAYFPAKWRLMAGDPSFPAAVRTDAEGQFELAGLPPDCRAALQISGPGVATQSVSVVTRPMAKIDVPDTGVVGVDAHGYYGVEFDHAVAPGTAVFGTVTDTETGEPLPGVRVDAHAIVNIRQTGHAEWTSRTDAEGRFRIEGLPVGSDLQIDVIPTPDQPYLPNRSIRAEASNEIEPLEMNIKLRRGVLVRGKVTALETGEPVDATLHYHPFLNNDFAKQYAGYDPRIYRYEGNDTRHRTGTDGSFQAVVIPGRGILGVQTIAREEYCAGLGAEGIETGPQGRFPTYNMAFPQLYQRVLEIDASPDAEVLEYNLTVSRGVSVKYAVNDPQGEPLTGVMVSGVTPGGAPSTEATAQSSIEFKSLRPGEKRRVLLLHRERRLGRVIEVVAPQLADNEAEPRTATLLPCGTVTGRLVNGEGEPIAGLMLAVYGVPTRDLSAISPQQAATDANGEFQLAFLPVGSAYRIVGNSREHGSVDVLSEFEFEPGETIDLGTIDITSDKRPEPRRVKQTTASHSNARSDSATDAAMTTVHGRVLGPDGQPVAGANVLAAWVFVRGYAPLERFPIHTVAETNSDSAGNFELKFVGDDPKMKRRHYGWQIVAYAPGTGPAWIRDEDVEKNSPLSLQLTADSSVHGRIVDLEGKPVTGVNVRVHELFPTVSEEDILEWIDDAKQKSPPAELAQYWQASMSGSESQYPGRFPTPILSRLSEGSPALPENAQTDADGRFVLDNLGANRLAIIEVSGPAIARSYLQVVNRDIEPISARPLGWLGIRSGTYYGREFEYVADLTQPIDGTVTDLDTGKPLVDVEVRLSRFAGEGGGRQENFLTTRTDAAGRYRLLGVPPGGGHRIEVMPDTDDPYFPTEKALDSTDGSLDPVTCDFNLKRGRWIVGKVTDAQSGEPIVDAIVNYLPLRSNERARDYPNFRPEISGTVPKERIRTADDGSFRVLAIPGAGLLAAIANGTERLSYSTVGLEGVPKHLVGEGGLLKAYEAWSVTGYHALREVEVDESVDEVAYDLEFTPGLSRLVKVVDTNSQPVQGVRVLGRTMASFLEEPTADSAIEVIGLRPNQQRPVAFLHSERRIGKAFIVSPGNELTVELEPCAVARGRFVDKDGEPVGDVEVVADIDHDDHLARRLISKTHADGRFEILLPPGLTYHVAHYARDGRFSAECEATAGAVFELGDLAFGTKLSAEQTAKLIKTSVPSNASSTTNKDLQYGGQVLDAEGRPVGGAKIHLVYWYSHQERPPDGRPLATTTADGQFQFALSRGDFRRTGDSVPPWLWGSIVAVADGHGVAWASSLAFETTGSALAEAQERAQLQGRSDQDIQSRVDAERGPLRLAQDDVPIEGRVVDTNGLPIEGAKVKVVDLRTGTDNTLDAFEQASRREGIDLYEASQAAPRYLYGPFVAEILPKTQSNDDGRFTLRTLGRDRLVQLVIEADGFETNEVYTRLRAAETITLADPLAGKIQVHGPSFTHVAAPSRPVEGVVRDAKTKRPVAGVLVTSQRTGIATADRQIQRAGSDFVRAVTNEAGRFRLSGLPNTQHNSLTFQPRLDQPYLTTTTRVDTRGADSSPVMLDVELTPAGGIVVGRVVDEVTGEGVSGQIRYLAVNKDATRPNSALAARVTGDIRSDMDGHFRFVAPAGPGYLAFNAFDESYRKKAPAPDGATEMAEYALFMVRDNGPQYHALEKIDLDGSRKEYVVELKVSRGEIITGQLLDLQGQPLSSSRGSYTGRVEFVRWQPLANGKFHVLNFDAARPRQLAFVDPDHQLAGQLLLDEKPQGPITVKLEPWATITGRIVDKDGVGIQDLTLAAGTLAATILPRPVERSAIPPSRLPLPPAPDGLSPIKTDSEGRFVITGLLPGVRYDLSGHRHTNSFDNLSGDIAQGLTLARGETRDLGSIELKPVELAEVLQRRQDAAKRQPNAPPSKPKTEDEAGRDDAATIRGRVIDAAGKPVAGANFYWFRSRVHDIDPMTPRLIATSDESGNFRFIPPVAGGGPSEVASWNYHERMVVRAPSHGFVLTSAAMLRREMTEGNGVLETLVRAVSGAKGAVMKLPAAGEPIRGRIVNTDGQPVAGATVRIRWFADRDSDRYSQRDVAARGGENAALQARVDHLLAVIEQVQLRDLLPSAITNAEGRFELRDIGPDQLVQLLIEGDGIESTEIVARNNGDEKIVLQADRHSDGKARTVYGREFLHAVGPSKAIEGRVLDFDTSEPISNAVVRAFHIHGNRLHSSREREQFATRTDAAGRYRITGLPIGAENELVAFATGDVPYIPVGQQADTSASGDTIQRDFRLKRGVWAEGRVFDADTDKPFTGEITYYYFRDSAFDEQWPGVRNAYVDGLYWTNARGEFRVPVLPSRGILAYRYEGDPFAMDRDGIDRYPRGYGAEEIAGSEDIGSMKMFPTAPHSLIPSNYQRVVEVSPTEGATSIRADMPLVAGKTLIVRIVDAAVLLRTEYQVYGAAESWGWQRITSREFNVEGLQPDEARKVFVFDRNRNLVGGATVRRDEEGPVEIELQEAGTIRGRLVDDEGEPITDATVATDYDKLWTTPGYAIWAPGRDLVANPTQIPVDRDGRFQLDGLVPGWKYSARASAPRKSGGEMMSFGIGRVFEDVTVEPGQSLDLGDISPSAGPRQANVNTPKPQPNSAQPAADTDAPNGTIRIHGRVLGPNGKPVPAAHMAAIGTSNRRHRGGDLDYEDDVLSQTTADADGRFQLALEGVSSMSHQRVFLIARADGTGLAWRHLNPDGANVEVSLELQDEELIRGRLVDIEGLPADGVQMSVRAVMLTRTDSSFPEGVGYRVFDSPPVAWPQAVTTGDDGEFVISGIPAGHGVFLEIEGSERFAPQELSLNTGMPEQRGEYDGTYRSLVKNLQPGEEAVLALAPAQIFEGVVRYEDTALPAPHARLTIWASQQKFGGSMTSVAGKADANGRYRINPKPGIRFGITAYAPDGAPYLTRRSPEVDWLDGAKTREVDISLPRGVLVRGRVVDAASGELIPGATVQYVPEAANNPHDADDILTGWQGIQLSNEQGEFEIVVLPGPGRLVVHGPQNEFVVRETSSRELSRGRPGGQRQYAHAIERVEPQPGAEPVEVTIELARSAKIAGRLVDEEGQPVEEAVLISQLNVWPTDLDWRGDASTQVLGGQFELSGMEPGEKCTVYFLDAKRRLGAKLALTADGTTPTVVLKPCGQATVRFINEEGQPRDNIRPTIHMVVTSGPHELDRDAADRGELAADSDFVANIDRTNYLPAHRTDSDGRLVYPALIPGATYRFVRYDDGNPSIVREFTVEPGLEVDLGEIALEEKN